MTAAACAALTQEELFTAQQELARIMEAMDVRFYARGEVQRSAPFSPESGAPLAAAIESTTPVDEAPNEELIHAFDGHQTNLTPSDADGFWGTGGQRHRQRPFRRPGRTRLRPGAPARPDGRGIKVWTFLSILNGQ